MITNATVLNDVQKAWENVRIYEAMVDTHTGGPPFDSLGMITSPEYTKLTYSLLVFLAFSVLEDVLKELHKQGTFKTEADNLKSLMDASRSCLPWRDFGAVENARNRRNEVAHDRKLLGPTTCKEYLHLIEDEFVSWKVLQHKIKGRYEISIG